MTATNAILARLVRSLILPAFCLLAAAPVGAATTGSITGVVTDSESGAALSGVNIALEGTSLTTVSDDKGLFTIVNVTPGPHTVKASLIGYAPAISAVEVSMDLASRTDIKLTPTVEEEPEIVIIEERILTAPQATQNLYVRTAQDQALAKAQPNSLNQVPSVVSTVPGVVQDSIGNLHIRGGNSDQIGWMIEGIPVTNPIDNTFGTNLVTVGMSRMEIYTGGYQAEYGNAISGVLNEIKKTGAEMDGANVEFTLGQQKHASVYVEAGNVLKNGLDWYVGNYTWQSDFIRNVASSAHSTDSVLKAVYPAGSKDKLTLLAMDGTAKYGLPHLDPEPTPDQNRTTQRYGLAGFTWTHEFTPTAHFLFRPYYFVTSNYIRGESVEILGYSSETRAIQRGLQAEFRTKFGKRHEATFGVWHISSDNREHLIYPVLTGDPSLDPLEYTTAVDAKQLAVFAQDKIRLNDQLALDVGVRHDRMSYSPIVTPRFKDSQTSPRIGVAWSKDPKSVVRASYGKFIQFVPTTALDRIYTNPAWDSIYAQPSGLKPERSSSFEVSFERQADKHTLFRMTPFYRNYRDLLNYVSVDTSTPGVPPFVLRNADKANAKGVELYAERRFSRATRGWISYTYSRVKQTSLENAGVWNYTDWDQRHTFDATIAHKVAKDTYTLRLQYGSGQPWTEQTDPTANTRRLSDTFVATFGMTHSLGAEASDEVVGLNIYNLFNTGAVTGKRADGSDLYYIMPRFISISYSAKL